MNAADAWLGMSVLVIAALGCAACINLLRPRLTSVSATGWGLLAGVIAGLLLGPTLFGRLAPETYERWYLGAVPEREEREQIARRHEADLAAATYAQSDPSQLNHLRDQLEREMAASTQRWRAAQWRHQGPLRALTLFVIAGVLLHGASHSIRTGEPRQGWLSPLTVGVWSAALPGGVAYAAMTGLWGYSQDESAVAAAALAIGPWMLTPLDREAADQAELGGARMLQAAGRVATVLAILAATWGLWSARGIEGALMALMLLTLPIGWLLGRPLRGLAAVNGFVLAPVLGALVAVKIEVIEDFAFWPLVLILLISDDARWMGAFCGLMLLGGRHALRTMRLVVGSVSAALTQVAVLAVAAHAWALPRHVALPLLLGSLLIEFTAGARRRLVQRLSEAEHQFPDQLVP